MDWQDLNSGKTRNNSGWEPGIITQNLIRNSFLIREVRQLFPRNLTVNSFGFLKDGLADDCSGGS